MTDAERADRAIEHARRLLALWEKTVTALLALLDESDKDVEQLQVDLLTAGHLARAELLQLERH